MQSLGAQTFMPVCSMCALDSKKKASKTTKTSKQASKQTNKSMLLSRSGEKQVTESNVIKQIKLEYG